jgi:serine/threonine protein kinase
VAESTTLFVKRFVHRGWIEQIWARWCLVFGKSRAGGEYRNARRLMNHNIPVVESLAYADRVTSFRCTDSLLVTRFLADATTAKESLRHERDRQVRTAIVVAIAEAVATLHGHQLLHGDLHLRNIMICRSGARVACHLIDFGSDATRPDRNYRVEDDLAGLFFSGHNVATWGEWKLFVRTYQHNGGVRFDRRFFRRSLAGLRLLYPPQPSRV